MYASLFLTAAMLLLAAAQPGLGCRQRDRDPAQVPAESAGAAGPTIRVSGRVRLNPAPASGALPANSRLVVQLQDISLADAPSKLLASQTFESAAAAYRSGGGEIPFTIEATVPTGTPFIGNSVAVSASLRGDGVSYFTDTAYFVDLTAGTFEYRDMVITIVKTP